MHLPSEASQAAVKMLKAVSRVREDRKVFALVLEGLAGLYACESGTIFTFRRATGELHKVTSLKTGETWDMEAVLSFFRNEKPFLPTDTIMAPVRSGPEVIGVVALRKSAGFERGAGRIATEILKLVGSVLAVRQEIAVSTAESSIARAALAGVSPKDVIYRALHQLRRFIDHSHGGTVIAKHDDRTGMVAARQVAWTKGKSQIVGARLPIMWQDLPLAFVDVVSGSAHTSVWEALASVREAGSPPKRSMLVASLQAEGDIIGCIELASRQVDFFLDKDKTVLSRFLSYLSWCLTQVQSKPGGRDE
jgi:hypothetical protein